MKNLPKYLTLLLFISAFFVFATGAHAAGTMYLSPASKSVTSGTTFTIAVREDSGSDGVNAVQANLTYPADKLDFVSISTAGTAFSIEAPSSGGGGNITISRGNVSDNTGDKLVVTLTFKSKVGSGTAAVNFADGTALVRSSDQANIANTKVGATITFTTPAAAPTAPAAPAKPVDKTAPVITVGPTAGTLGKNSATISWTTDEASSSVVEWGPTNQYGIIGRVDGNVTAHVVALDSKLLIAGQTYYYRVHSADAAGNEVVSAGKTFATLGEVKVEEPTTQAAPGLSLSTFLDRRFLLILIAILILLEIFLVIRYRDRISFFKKKDNPPV